MWKKTIQDSLVNQSKYDQWFATNRYQEDDNSIISSLVPRTDKHVDQPRWGVGVPFVAEENREQLHKQLELEGYVNPVADVFNAMLYASEGEFWKGTVAGAMILPGADYLKKAPKFLKKVIQPALTRIKEYKYSGELFSNQKIDILGNTAKYVNPKKILSDGKEYVIKTTDDFVDMGTRKAVVVEIADVKTGKTIYQPFYKSTGHGAPEIKSQGNWLPFEGIVPKNMNKHISIITGPKSSYQLRGPKTEGMWKDLTVPKTLENPVGIRKDFHRDGWLVKAFKNTDGDLVDSSIIETKRGLDIHKQTDLYLQNLWNK